MENAQSLTNRSSPDELKFRSQAKALGKQKQIMKLSGQSEILLCSVVQDTINFEMTVLMKCSLHVQ